MEDNIAGPAGSAAPGNGGAFHVSGVASSRFIGGQVSNNIAANEGGGLWNQAGSNLFVSNVQINDNVASGDGAANGGGGIFNNGGDVQIAGDTTLTDNIANGAAGSGGGLLSVDGTISVNESSFTGNVANRAGGGIELVDGALNIRNADFTSNVAGPEGSASPGNGGAYHVSGVANTTFVGGTVTDNIAATEGGGLWNQAGSNLLVSDVEITGNVALGDAADDGGGGVFNNGGTVRIVNGTSITSNIASGASGSGGGIFSTAGQVLVSQSVVSSNTANRAGGGVEVIDGRFVFRQSELSSNIAGPDGSAAPGNGGGLHVSGSEASTFIQNSEVTGNVAALEGGGLWNQAGSFLRVDGSSEISSNVASGDDADNGGGGIFNNGGRVSVIDATISQNTADGVLGSGGGLLSIDGEIFVNDAVISANGANRAGGGIEIVDGRLDVFNSSLLENSAGTQSLDAASPGNGGAFHVTGTSTRATFHDSLISGNTAASEGGALWNQAGSTLFVTGTRIVDNTALGDDADQGGGGVYNNGGNVRVIDSFITGNVASGVSGSGGGIFSTDGQVLINDTVISSNTANRAGGGIEVIDGFTRLENVTADENLAGGDSANPGNGGAVHVSGVNSTFAIIDSTFTANVATNEGGALWNQRDSVLALRGSTELRFNSSEGQGGGIYNRGRLLAQDALFESNTSVDEGGGIFTTASGNSFLTQSSFDDNVAGGVGGGLSNFGNTAVVDSVFENNDALDGGAIFGGENASTSQARNTFTGNTPNNVS